MKEHRLRMNTQKQWLALIICLVMVLSLVPAMPKVYATDVDSAINNMDANGVLGKNSDVGIVMKDSVIGEAGEELELKFSVQSTDPDNIKLRNIYPVIDNTFPFETSGDAYKIVFAKKKSEKKQLDVSYKLTAASELETGYHSTRFVCEYSKKDSEGISSDFYVIKTINIYFDGVDSSDGDDGDDGDDNLDDGDDDNTGYDDGDDGDDGDDNDYHGGDDDDDKRTTPKLIVTGYETKPEKVMAGETFKITFHIQNTSKTTSVKNAKFLIGNESGSILPAAGSSSVFIDSIAAGGTGDVEIEMKTNADLAQKSYILSIKGDFDDDGGNTYSYAENVYLPVYQKVKLSLTDVSMNPEVIGIDQEGELIFTVENQGSAGVYNVSVSVDDAAVFGEEVYVGNVAGSNSAYGSILVTGVADNTDTGLVKLVISYEDAEGNQETIEQEVDCIVDELAEESFEDDFLDEDFEEDEDSGIGKIILIVVILLLVVAAVVVTIILLRRRKRKLMEALEAEDDGEVDFEDEDF